MSLLDELKRQAESQKAQQRAQEEDRTRTLTAVHEALLTTCRYLTELANSLNVVKPAVPRSFVVHGNARLDNLMQGDYTVRERKKTVEFRDYFEQVVLRFHAVGTQGTAVESYAAETTQRLQNYLQGYGLRFETRQFRNDLGHAARTTVSIMPDVPASIAATADWETGILKFKLRNVEAIGDTEYCYEPGEVDRALLDELAKLVLGKPNTLRSLGKHQEMLRVKIVAQPAPVTPEPQEVEPPRDAVPQQEPRSGLLGSLKSLWKK